MLATAYHEAGHAVVAHALGYPLLGISIDPATAGKLGYSGSDVLTEKLKQSSNWQRHVVGETDWKVACDDVVIYLAGATSEEKHNGRDYRPDPDEPRSTDEQQVLARLVRMCGSDYHAQNALYAELLERAHETVREHWSEIDALAGALVTQRTMTPEETLAVITAAVGGS